MLSHYKKICHKYNNRNYNHIISNCPVNGFKSEILNAEHFKSFKDIEFEKSKLMISSNIDEMLTGIFGDYMKLPPEEKRISNHKMKAYWR